MIKYRRISFFEREEISRQIALGLSFRTIACLLKRAPSSISREISQSKVIELKYYRAIFAQQQSHKTRHRLRKNRKLINNAPLRKFVLSHLAKNWSPGQIAKRLILLYPGDMDMRISHQAIYSYIYVLPRGTLKHQLVAYLKRHHKHCHKKKRGQRGGPITDYLSIEERPKEVENRIIPGHWEGDMLVGSSHDSCMGTLVERTTRMTLLVKLATQSSSAFRKAFAEKFRHLPRGLKNTLTYDQGKEMAQHKLFTKETNITVYFAHPHSPWERGTNENTNGLLRQYFPKNTNFARIPKERIKMVQDELNDRPRKTLDWHTPHEKFVELLR